MFCCWFDGGFVDWFFGWGFLVLIRGFVLESGFCSAPVLGCFFV